MVFSFWFLSFFFFYTLFCDFILTLKWIDSLFALMTHESTFYLSAKCTAQCVLLYDFFLCAGPYVLVCSSYLLLLQHIWIWNKGMLIKFHIILISAFKIRYWKYLCNGFVYVWFNYSVPFIYFETWKFY